MPRDDYDSNDDYLKRYEEARAIAEGDLDWIDDLYYLAEGYHTALRKVCDGYGSSVLWNALHLASKDDLNLFYNIIAKMSGTVKKRSIAYDLVAKPGPARNLINIGIHLMDDNEWAALNEFLGHGGIIFKPEGGLIIKQEQ